MSTKERNLVERFFQKHFRRIAIRCDKLARNSFSTLGAVTQTEFGRSKMERPIRAQAAVAARQETRSVRRDVIPKPRQLTHGLIAQPETVTSIGMRERAHVGHTS
jgi:hypothetical protein